MDQCRICRKRKNKLLFINDSCGETTYFNMITSLANIKIEDNNLFSNKICPNCVRQLKEAYHFKIYIQKSHDTLNEASLLKKLYFSDINEIKRQLKLANLKTNTSKHLSCPEVLESDRECILYNDIVIKKIYKEDKEICYSSVGGQNGNENIGFDDYNSDNKIISEFDKPSKHKTKQSKCETKAQNLKTCLKPIKPKIMKSIVLLQAAPNHIKATVNSKEKRQYKSRQDICPFCGKITKSLKSHMEVHKAGQQKYKCDICDKNFSYSITLKQHKQKHTGTKDYKCDLCTAAFWFKHQLTKHMIIHTPQQNFFCKTCSKGFKRKSAMMRHMDIHKFGKKKIQCDQCDMSFHTNATLNHHMRVHTGERPYNCQICLQPYSYKHDFNRHCFKKHGVSLKRRSIYVMNEEVLAQERILMRDLLLRIQGVIKDDKPLNPFDGPQAHLAFEQAVKALESNQIRIDL